ncbi:MAG TPA: IS200/IS605 family transposase [Saprospiraceae bacterium]|nr:IS200/IS605 family transposase [Saprospiraceae bacterium]
MSTYTQILYHIVFSTKNREKNLYTNNREELFKYISGVIDNKKCHLYQINGVEDHLHILTSLHPSISLSDLVKDIKVSSSLFIKKNNLFPKFTSWQEGYGGFTVSMYLKDSLIDYIKNQEAHHHKVTYIEEFINLLKQHEIEFDPKYLI